MGTLGLFAFFMLVVVTTAQIPIPKRELGFVYNSGSDTAPIKFDFYIDQICPYSKQAWPTILALADSYGSSILKLKTHLFPLPYHRNSFYASKGTHIVNKLTSGNLTYHWIKVIFDQMDTLVNNATFSVPDNQIVQKFANISTNMFGLASAVFTSMLMSEDIELATRLGWKYCCTRGIPHTPTFMVNDVNVAGDPTWTVADWRMVIDPLLTKSRQRQEKAANSTCPLGIKQCEYLPHKIECCKEGEFCIPNVGCRC